MDHIGRTPRKSRTPVLVVVHADGYIGIYGRSDEVSVVVRYAPDVETSSRGEIFAEDYIESTLSQTHRDVYYPGSLLTTGQVRSILPSEIVRRNDELSISRMVDRILSARAQEKKKQGAVA